MELRSADIPDFQIKKLMTINLQIKESIIISIQNKELILLFVFSKKNGTPSNLTVSQKWKSRPFSPQQGIQGVHAIYFERWRKLLVQSWRIQIYFNVDIIKKKKKKKTANTPNNQRIQLYKFHKPSEQITKRNYVFITHFDLEHMWSLETPVGLFMIYKVIKLSASSADNIFFAIIMLTVILLIIFTVIVSFLML